MSTPRIVAFLIVLLLAGCQTSWTEYTVADGKVSVLSPAPLEAQEAGPRTTVYSTSDGRYSVVASRFERTDAPEKALDLMKKVTIQQSKAKESHSSETSVDGNPALRFGMQVPESGRTVGVEALSFALDGELLVQFMVTDGVDHQKFFDSIKLH